MLAACSDHIAAAPREPVDRRHLARYTMGDAALEGEVLQLFAGQLPALIDGLKAAAGSKEKYVAAHTLKGSARAVGAWSLAGLAEEAERSVQGGGAIKPEILVRLEAQAAEVIAYVTRALLIA